MSEHHLDDFIRQIDPSTFSETAHGTGHRVVLSDGQANRLEPKRWGGLFSRQAGVHYFVKRWSVPKEVKTWTFHWSEGTSAISLDFDSSFVIQANEDIQALKLVESLQGPEEPGEILYGLINAQLHQELKRLLLDCDSKAENLLDRFRSSNVAVGKSVELNSLDKLNQNVSTAVAQALGGAHFRIGFQLRYAPPMQVEIRRKDEFRLADSKQARTAETTALLQLCNYQAYKKSGLETEEAIRQAIGRSIAQAVKKLLFAGKYYEVVRSFTKGEKSIAEQMHEDIEKEAKAIGYHVEMFQTFPDIAALRLLEVMRIDIPADEEKYYLVNSRGHVQVSVALSVQVKQNCSEKDIADLRLLIDPDERDVVGPITTRVKQICRDTIHRFDRMVFNLRFPDEVVPKLGQAIANGLGSYGLDTQVINIMPAPTEEANRFKDIRGKTIDFAVSIPHQGDDGPGDLVPLVGKVEVVGITNSGWDMFEAKDFGYREDSSWTDLRLRHRARALGLVVPDGQSPISDTERRALAIEMELCEIRDRVVSTLKESLSKGIDMVGDWRTLEDSHKAIKWIQTMASETIEREFGLSIALRGVIRGNSDSEETAQQRHQASHTYARNSIKLDLDSALARRRDSDDHRAAMLSLARIQQKDALENESDPMHHEVRANAIRELERIASAPRLSVDDAAAVPSPPREQGSRRQAPWKTQPPQDEAPKPNTEDGKTSG